ncbi:hypothetical protein BFAG_03228 [Bacteroides fragilis 3_1_12]|uniref:Uncharacterized protein n=1 Tax=Bacteroides fragilis 3_1_12 TaxID=457424 RepID=A0ABN0BNJ0_BACFG|nr:hypothetical protein BFAG_03228 [Bacteroides fragilis 3_1_12]
MAYTGLLHCTIGEETIFPFYFLLKINAENIKNTNNSCYICSGLLK